MQCTPLSFTVMSCTSSARIHASPPPQVGFVGGVDILTTPPTILNAAIVASTTTPIRPCNLCIQSVARPASAPAMETPLTKAEKVSDNGRTTVGERCGTMSGMSKYEAEGDCVVNMGDGFEMSFLRHLSFVSVECKVAADKCSQYSRLRAVQYTCAWRDDLTLACRTENS